MAEAVLTGKASLRSAGVRAGLSENAVGPRLARTQTLGAYANDDGRVTAAAVERAKYDHEAGSPRPAPASSHSRCGSSRAGPRPEEECSMTDKNLTHIYLLLDRSGSMQSIKTDTEGGFAAFVEEQSARPASAGSRWRSSTTDYDVVYTDRPIADVPALDLQPRGSTALLDAMGGSITDAGAKLAALAEDERPDTVIVAIMTDGYENASQEWTHPAIKSLVEQQTEQYGWQFLYMGADQDAIEVGASLGIKADHAVTLRPRQEPGGDGLASAKISHVRTSRAAGDAAAPMPAFTDEERRDLAE